MAFPLPTMWSEVSQGVFPLPAIPSIPWQNVPGSRNAHFGAPRTEINPKTGKPYPTHGACDLIATHDTPIYAVADGEVWRRRSFYESWGVKAINGKNKVVCHQELFELAIIHEFFIARYSEISANIPAGMGKTVKAGQTIALVGPNCAEYQMLHFEMFADVSRRDSLSTGSGTKYLYVPQRDYARRSDLLDPTPYLDRWASEMRQQQFEAERLFQEGMKQIQGPDDILHRRPPAPQRFDW
jgi:murein DD-endopeptidase MepM/ murein hydrolase activator NlpD